MDGKSHVGRQTYPFEQQRIVLVCCHVLSLLYRNRNPVVDRHEEDSFSRLLWHLRAYLVFDCQSVLAQSQMEHVGTANGYSARCCWRTFFRGRYPATDVPSWHSIRRLFEVPTNQNVSCCGPIWQVIKDGNGMELNDLDR